MNDIIITVSGVAGSGNISCASLIYKVLTEYGLTAAPAESISEDFHHIDSTRTLTELLKLLSNRRIIIDTKQQHRETLGE